MRHRLTLLVLVCLAASCSDDPSTLSRNGTSGTSGTSGSGTSGTSGDNGSSGTSGTSGNSGAPGSSGTPAGGSTAAEICVNTINMYRMGKGLPAYARWTEMETCADGEATSDGSGSTAHGAFGKCGENAQNECPGWPGPPDTMIPKCLASMYAQGPGEGHYDAIMSNQYTKVSCGFGTAPGGGIWSVQNFH